MRVAPRYLRPNAPRPPKPNESIRNCSHRNIARHRRSKVPASAALFPLQHKAAQQGADRQQGVENMLPGPYRGLGLRILKRSSRA